MFSSKPVEIVSVIRRMRGGSQSFLVRAADGCAYVAKFAGNPQGSKSLINECIANYLLLALGVATPQVVILRLGDLCAGREQLYFSTDYQTPVMAGLHLGSRCPVDPQRVAIFDFLPRTMHSRMANPDDVGTVLAFDAWTAHADRRQYVFARQRHYRQAGSKNPNGVFTAWAIDNGRSFGGDWTLRQAMPTSLESLDLRLFHDLDRSSSVGAEMIRSLPGFHFQTETYQQIPQAWFGAGDETALKSMLVELNSRREHLDEMIQCHLEALISVKKKAS